MAYGVGQLTLNCCWLYILQFLLVFFVLFDFFFFLFGHLTQTEPINMEYMCCVQYVILPFGSLLLFRLFFVVFIVLLPFSAQ